MDEYVVYKYDKSSEKPLIPECADKTYFVKKYLFGDKEQLYKTLLFTAAAKGKQKIVCVKNPKGELVHYSFVIPYCAKFSFMERDDICIGPCWTCEDYRGKGIYGNTLNYISITTIHNNPMSNCYVLVRAANSHSTQGVKKANFIPVGIINKTKYLRHYKKVAWLNQ